MAIELLRNAEVVANSTYDHNGKRHLEIVVNDKFKHTFPTSSKFSTALKSHTIADIESRLNRGHFLFVGNELADFRDGNYKGFVHDDEAISQLAEHIGVMTKGLMRSNRRSGGWGTDAQSGLILGKTWSESLIDVPIFAEGGKFKTEVSFVWNPFSQFVNSVIDVMRLICSNGMTTTTNIVNTKIPLVNKWVEHLDIASVQIQNKTNSVFGKRMIAMAHNRASVTDVKLVADHATRRYASNILDPVAKGIVEGIYIASNPVFHLDEIYTDAILNNGVMAFQLPSHLTQFDLYNLITELRTHSNPSDTSTQFALDKFANDLVFNEQDDTRFITKQYSKPILSTFSDPDRAFFGNVYDGALVA